MNQKPKLAERQQQQAFNESVSFNLNGGRCRPLQQEATAAANRPHVDTFDQIFEGCLDSLVVRAKIIVVRLLCANWTCIRASKRTNN